MTLFDESVELLKNLIAIPSFSREEDKTANLLVQFLEDKDIKVQRRGNNVWALCKHFDPSKPTILLNSHHDTVKPNNGYTRDPFDPVVENGKLYGLGSNDAGGPLVSLLATFINFYGKTDLKYNLVFAASAEEEVSGKGGIVSILEYLPDIDCAIVGEPTRMRMAIAEKGLMVLECTTKGESDHAARDEGENAIYKAMADIEWFRTFHFPEQSELLGPVKMTVTVLKAGEQHNVVPDRCFFTVDVRSTDTYSNKEILKIIKENITSEVDPRSIRLNPSFIPQDHPLVKAGNELGIAAYGSPTLSDQSVIPAPSLKMGPGKSSRSHTANEFIELQEIEDGIQTYINLLTKIL